MEEAAQSQGTQDGGDRLGELDLEGMFKDREKEAYVEGRIEGLIIRHHSDLQRTTFWQWFSLLVLLGYAIFGIVMRVMDKAAVDFSLLVMSMFIIWILGSWRKIELERELHRLRKEWCRLESRRRDPYRQPASARQRP